MNSYYLLLWRDYDVRQVFPDCDNLFARLQTHHSNYIEGVLYHRCCVDSFVTLEALINNKGLTADETQKMHEFVKWLMINAIEWDIN